MKVTADTNVLVRALTDDDARHSPIARSELTSAELVALPLPALCELAWVLARRYHFSAVEIAAGIRRLIDGANVVTNRPAVEAGLAHLESGGDFADGVVAHEGRWLGADVLITFDKDAALLQDRQGHEVRLLD